MTQWLRLPALLALLATLAVMACGHSRPIHVLAAPPQTAYRTLGMVSGQGENRESAIHAVRAQAERMDADAVIIAGERPAGKVVIVTATVIRYLAPPPER